MKHLFRKNLPINELLKFEFRLLDIDYRRIGPKNDQYAQLQLFGRLENGQLILVRINDFKPYFYVQASPEALVQINKPIWKTWLSRTERVTKRVYDGGKRINVLKVVGKRPWDLAALGVLFEQHKLPVFETDISYVKRFLLDSGLHGLGMTVVQGRVRKKEPILILDASASDVHPSNEIETNPWTPLVMSIKLEVGQETYVKSLDPGRILSISVTWGRKIGIMESKTFILTDASDTAERQLFQDFLSFFDKIQPDVIVTFDHHDSDLSLLLARLNKFHINPARLSVTKTEEVIFSASLKTIRIKGRVVIDAYAWCRFVSTPSGFKDLESIASYLLGSKKENKLLNITQLWQESLKEPMKRQKIQKQIVRNSKLIYRLYWALGISEWMEVRHIAGVPLGAGITTTGRLCGEFLVMRECVDHSVLIPPMPSPQEVARRRIERRTYPHVGGLVTEPGNTIYQGVIITDFKAFYPSIMIAYNIGGETFHGDVDTPKDIFEHEMPENLFSPKPQSCLSRMLSKILAARWVIKTQIKNSHESEDQDALNLLMKREQAFKIVVNSMYGAQNYIRGRFYSLYIGNAITTISWKILGKTCNLIANGPIPKAKVVYGDTDSAFIHLQDSTPIDAVFESTDCQYNEKMAELKELTSCLLEYVNSKFPPPIQLSLHDIAYRVAFSPGRKKSYSYVSVLSPRFPLEIKGFEAVRSDWSPIARKAQINILNTILREKMQPFEKAREKILTQCVELLQESIESLKPKTTILTSITRPPHTYVAPTPSLGAFLHYCEITGQDPNAIWKQFDRFPYLITPGKKLLAYRSRHPLYVKQIDRWYYITEIIRVVSRFGLKLTLKDVKRQIGNGLPKYLELKQNVK
ncbi:MAG: DNA polymerase domain-containing protein [Promethearchaeota archaeon]